MERDPHMIRTLLTGGTGSLGTALIPAFLKQDYDVTILSRDPHKQEKLLALYPNVHAILADVRDRDAILRACQGQDIVVHAAALKIVSRGETDPREYMQVNVLGSLNVAEACRKQGISKAILISTDKSPNASTSYGISKYAAERIWIAEQTPYNITKFSCVRYGNVVSSNGSVWHVWQERVKQGLPLQVREPEPTRFFLTMADAVKIVMDALHLMNGGEIFVPSAIPAFSLWDLAQELQAPEQWQYEPLGATEKQHEILVAPTEFVEPIFGYDTNLWRVLPRVAPSVQRTPKQFCSQTARRLTGKEVIAKLGS